MIKNSAFLLLTIICLASYHRELSPLLVKYEVYNTDIVEQILAYRKTFAPDSINDVHSADSIFVGVYCKEINDSIRRFVLFPVYDIEDISSMAPLFVCSIGGQDVFFTPNACHSLLSGSNSFFGITEGEKEKFRKRYFPNEGEQSEDGSVVISIYDPLLRFLTFLGDSLIDVTNRQGLYDDKILLRVGYAESYY